MDYKRLRKVFEYFFTWLALYACSLIFSIIPLKQLYSIAGFLGSFFFRITGKHRKTALNSLEIAFGNEKNAFQRGEIAHGCFTNLTKSVLELISLTNGWPALRKIQVNLVNREVLDKALEKKKGIILVSAHFGNFPLAIGKLLQNGYGVSVIARPMRNPRVEKLLSEKIRDFNLRIINSMPRRECIINTLRSLRNNESVFILLDQNFGTSGVFVDFFGTKAATATGPVVLAQRTGSSIVPCFIVRQPDNSHNIIFEPAVEIIKGKNEEETIALNVQRITKIIEFYIRLYPEEWGWIHRRWKSRPKITEGGA